MTGSLPGRSGEFFESGDGVVFEALEDFFAEPLGRFFINQTSPSTALVRIFVRMRDHFTVVNGLGAGAERVKARKMKNFASHGGDVKVLYREPRARVGLLIQSLFGCPLRASYPGIMCM